MTYVASAAFVSNILGGSGTSSGSRVVNHSGTKRMDIYFRIKTGGQLAPLTEYVVGSIPNKPFDNLDVYFVGNRESGGDAPFTIKIDGNGDIKLNPLTTIPSGVMLVAYASYHYT